MSMSKLQIGIISAVIVAGVTIPLVLRQQSQNKLREANDALQSQTQSNLLLAAENARLASEAARAKAVTPVAPQPSSEMLKLRGELGRLRQENADVKSAKGSVPSALSGVIKDPATYKLIRDQQKAGMGMVYKDLTKRLKLTTEQSEKLTDLLADNVMENVDHIMGLLHDGKSPEEMRTELASLSVALQDKVRDQLGEEGAAKFREYTQNIGSQLTAEQFKDKLSGDKSAKEAKAKQLAQAMQEETQQALAAAGLPADYQTVPMLNFLNIASEAEAEKNLKLFDDIYGRVQARTASFLSEDEIRKFGEFRTLAINNSRAALTLNRKMMAPAGK
jgi:hypothetical protein